MKKIILILLLILPILITSLAFMIAGFVGREVQMVPITGIYTYNDRAYELGVESTDAGLEFITWMREGATINLFEFIRVSPDRANPINLRFDVVYEGTATPTTAVTVTGGVLQMVRDPGRAVEVHASAGGDNLMILVIFQPN
ncbi:MAG: hypothetical protein FWE38_02460 [Firmicutes bacterium]|nr:hypothetical protein [Bacillota bacterium]